MAKLPTEVRNKMGYAKGGGKLKMVEKDGKKVPFFAADGVGKISAELRQIGRAHV